MSSAHYEIDAWVDFARGLCPDERMADMERHRSSCAECLALSELLAGVWKIGRSLAGNTAPEEWSRRAEQILQTEKLAPVRRLPSRAAVLSFDSFDSLTPANVRSSSGALRYVIYETKECTVDLKVEDSPQLQGLSIVGQITDRRAPDKAIPTTPVFLFAGHKLLASTSSNEFGEFQIACKSKRKVWISFPFDDWRIDVKLDRLDEGRGLPE